MMPVGSALGVSQTTKTVPEVPIDTTTSPGRTASPRAAPALSPAPAPSSSGSDSATPSRARAEDRKSTSLNSSHLVISYAVFCLKKKKHTDDNHAPRVHAPHTPHPNRD